MWRTCTLNSYPNHEAGHAFTGFVSGRLVHVSVGPSLFDRHYTCRLSRDDREDLTFLYAGIAAQRVRLQELGFGALERDARSLTGADDDLAEAEALAQRLYGGEAGQEIRAIVERLNSCFGQVPAWAIVTAIAEELRPESREPRVLDRDDVDRIFAATMAKWRARGSQPGNDT